MTKKNEAPRVEWKKLSVEEKKAILNKTSHYKLTYQEFHAAMIGKEFRWHSRDPQYEELVGERTVIKPLADCPPFIIKSMINHHRMIVREAYILQLLTKPQVENQYADIFTYPHALTLIPSHIEVPWEFPVSQAEPKATWQDELPPLDVTCNHEDAEKLADYCPDCGKRLN